MEILREGQIIGVVSGGDEMSVTGARIDQYIKFDDGHEFIMVDYGGSCGNISKNEIQLVLPGMETCITELLEIRAKHLRDKIEQLNL